MQYSARRYGIGVDTRPRPRRDCFEATAAGTATLLIVLKRNFTAIQNNTIDSVARERLWRSHFHSTQIVTIGSWCRVVDRHTRTAQRRRTVLHLHPVGITRRSEVLVDKGLPS